MKTAPLAHSSPFAEEGKTTPADTRALGQLLRLLRHVAPQLTVGTMGLVIAHCALTAAFTIASGFLIGTVPATIAQGTSMTSPAGGSLAFWLATVIGLFVALRFCAPYIEVLAESLARRVDRELRLRTMRAVGTPSTVSHLEDPLLLDRIRNAQGVGTGSVTPGAAAAALCFNMWGRINVIAAGLILARFRWWLALVLVAYGWIARHRLVRDAVVRFGAPARQNPELRRSDYLRDLALTQAAAKDIRVFGLGTWLLDRFHASWISSMTTVWQRRKEQTPSLSVWNLPWGVLTFVSLFWIGRATADGELEVGELAIYAQAAIAASSIWISDADIKLAVGAAAIPAVLDVEAAAKSSNRRGTEPPQGAPRVCVRFNDVTFRYAGQCDDVVRGLNLVIPAGRSLAIVGPNGAGKTTLVKLLAGLYTPSSGSITADGIDIATFDASAWQRRVAAIFQDFARYPLSAHENIALGALDRLDDREAVARAAAELGIKDMLEGLPKQWDTLLSPEFAGGIDLSGGQWQRVALARALFAVKAGAALLVLDEPTAHLDVRTEADLMAHFLELTRGVTTILISHRFSSVRHADRIVVLAEGKIAEDGSHAELMDLGGMYAEMFTLQASRFTEGRADHATDRFEEAEYG